jgi:hypothetical protein
MPQLSLSRSDRSAKRVDFQHVPSICRQFIRLNHRVRRGRRETRRLCVSPRPLWFIACKSSHGSNTDETPTKDEKIEQEQTERTERLPDLRYLCLLLLTNLTADSVDTRPGAPGITSFVFIRAYPRHPRFFFIIPQIDILRGAQRDKRLVVRITRKQTTNGTNHTNDDSLFSCNSCLFMVSVRPSYFCLRFFCLLFVRPFLS